MFLQAIYNMIIPISDSRSDYLKYAAIYNNLFI